MWKPEDYLPKIVFSSLRVDPGDQTQDLRLVSRHL